MKLTLPPKIKKTIKILSVLILIITVIAFWVAAFWLFQEEQTSNENNCNVAQIKLYDTLFTFVKEMDSCLDCASSETIVNQIRDADLDDNIKAILLTVDSAGGWPIAGQEIANALKQATKPTVALIRNMGLSASYLAATGAGRIFASKLSDVGSIGITMSYVDNVNKNQREGLTYNQLSIGKYKDTSDPNKPLTRDEREMLMADLKETYDVFVSDIAQNRGLDLEKVKRLADGNSMVGQKALDNDLIDQLGDIFSVEKYLNDKIGEPAAICH